MIDNVDFAPIKYRNKIKCMECGCKNKDVQYYLTEWTFYGASTDGMEYCEKCIIKNYPNIKR